MMLVAQSQHLEPSQPESNMVLRDSQQVVSDVYVDVSFVKCVIRRESESAVRCVNISRYTCLSSETSHHEAAQTQLKSALPLRTHNYHATILPA